MKRPLHKEGKGWVHEEIFKKSLTSQFCFSFLLKKPLQFNFVALTLQF